MRKAAGIILIIFGAFELGPIIIGVIGLSVSGFLYSPLWWPIIFQEIVWSGFFVAAGVLCLKRKYWGLCLATALLVFLIRTPWVVEQLLNEIPISIIWGYWIRVIGALISTIFISLRKKEWKEFADSMDYEVSNGG
jgi:predicted neutral ceramidase superfamily lipid hydrolase